MKMDENPRAVDKNPQDNNNPKSSFVNSLETDLFDLNPNANCVVLSFNFEINFETLYTSTT